MPLRLMQNVPYAERSRLWCYAGGDKARGRRSLTRGVRPGGRRVLLGEGQHQCFQRIGEDRRRNTVCEHAFVLTTSQ
jgi:hypothetical protein